MRLIRAHVIGLKKNVIEANKIVKLSFFSNYGLA